MRKIYLFSLPHISQTSVECICQIIVAQVIGWVEPFFLEFAPQGFSSIQMWRVWWKKEQVQPSFLPIWYSFLYCLGFVYTRIIQNYEGLALYVKRKFFQEFQNKPGVNVLFRNLPSTLALPVYQSEAIELIRFFREKTYILTGKLPPVRHVSLTAYMGLISIINIDFPLATHCFKFIEFFYLKLVMFRHRFAFGPASYTFISSASVFKKALKVVSHTFFPLLASHCAFAVRIRCLLSLIAARIAALYSKGDKIGLRPRPGLVLRPVIPSRPYRLNQLLTLIAHIPVMAPTSLDLRPSAFNNMLWQRIRKQWLEPCLSPVSNSCRCAAVSTGVLTRPIMKAKI